MIPVWVISISQILIPIVVAYLAVIEYVSRKNFRAQTDLKASVKEFEALKGEVETLKTRVREIEKSTTSMEARVVASVEKLDGKVESLRDLIIKLTLEKK